VALDPTALPTGEPGADPGVGSGVGTENREEPADIGSVEHGHLRLVEGVSIVVGAVLVLMSVVLVRIYAVQAF